MRRSKTRSAAADISASTRPAGGRLTIGVATALALAAAPLLAAPTAAQAAGGPTEGKPQALQIGAAPALAAARAQAPSGPTEGKPQEIRAGAAPSARKPPVMIVLDASGSMNAADAPGPRIDAAKDAVTKLIADLPADASVGLQVFGTRTGSSDAEKAAGCNDITTLAPVGKLDKASLTAKVAGIRASGYTPIGKALLAAARALPTEGPRSIVLVSDGEDTCAPPPPCDVARDLKQQGFDLTIHTVGFKVDATARSQLSCIAEATGGSYADVQDGPGLEDALSSGISRAALTYQPKGTPIKGASAPNASARALTPGQYLDTITTSDIAQAEHAKYYRLPLSAGATPWVSATVIGVPASSDQALTVRVQLVDSQDRECISRPSISAELGFPGVTPIASATVGGAVFPTDPAWTSWCKQSDQVWIKLTRSGDHAPGKPLPVELQIRSEPAVASTQLPPPVTKRSTPPTPVPAAPSGEVNGAPDLSSAPVLPIGKTVTDTVVSGENRIYRVPVRWGQQAVVRADLDAAAAAGRGEPRVARMSMLNPVREDLTLDTAATAIVQQQPNGAGLVSAMKIPARWTNRTKIGDGPVDRDRYALDGYYFVVLSVDNPAGTKPVTVPVTLTTAVVGKAEAGPSYRAASSGKGAVADATPSGSAPRATGATTGGGSAAPGTSAGNDGSAAPSSPGADSSEAAGTGSASASATESAAPAGSTDTPSSAAESASASATEPAAPAGSTDETSASVERSGDTEMASSAAVADRGLPPWVIGAIAGIAVLVAGGVALTLGRRRSPGGRQHQ